MTFNLQPKSKFFHYWNFEFGKDYISGCVNFSFNCQSVSLLQAYLLLELSSSRLLAGTGGNQRQPALWYLVATVWWCPSNFIVNQSLNSLYVFRTYDLGF